MRCSVITPCFNPGRYLKPMLESVAARWAAVAKHIVMDGDFTTIDDVCQRETEELRARYGVTANPSLRALEFRWAKLRVFVRMLFQGCLKDRLY